MKIAVFGSHEGTTLQAIIDACAAGRVSARVCVVISNNKDSGVLRRARAADVPAYHLSSQTHPEPSDLDEAICHVLVEHRADLVVLAGYMRLLGERTLRRFEGRVLNTHPALLPKFGGKGMYGSRVHEAVVAAREPRSGATVHVVTSEYDAGPIVAQSEIPVLDADTPETLAARVQREEQSLLLRILTEIAVGEIRLPFERDGHRSRA
ncbi:MAG TPA: phosphoribosylglycinamide formyltransferase [Clostridiales bacterium UBA8153]|nr:phosphoribosylglycinamide formyltransferase [Clostridiales bacterium UBA8153]